MAAQASDYFLDPIMFGSSNYRSVLVILGPTASGKSALGLIVAGEVGGEIISADARQIYKMMDIGTAKPSADDLNLIRHHFIDELPPDQNFNAGEFGREGRRVINEIMQRGKIPIVVGGSGLYIQGLVDGFFDAPPADLSVREILLQRLDTEGPEILLEELRNVDPAAAARMLPSNTRRIIRALEVYTLTGIPISELQKTRAPASFDAVMVGIEWDRRKLYERINRRVDNMIEKGLLEEVRNLMAKGYAADLNSLQTVGYAEAFAYFKGECTYDEMIVMIKQNSRRYAKRQLTWFRKDERIKWFKIEDESELSFVGTLIADHFLSTHGRR